MKIVILTSGVMLLTALLTGCQEPTYVHVGPNWDNLQKLQPDTSSFPVKVRADSHYKVGEPMRFSVYSERPGQLWIVQVDPEDQVSVLFPNKGQSDSSIPGGVWVSVPPERASWTLDADKPLGASMLAFIVATGDVDVANILERNQPGGGANAGTDSDSDAERARSDRARSKPSQFDQFRPKTVRVGGEGGSWGVAKQVVEVAR